VIAEKNADGRVQTPRAIPAEDEVWAVSAAFTAMQSHLTTVLSQLKRAGIQIGSTTEQIVATSARYEHGASEQASALNETSATTEELARSARQIAKNATRWRTCGEGRGAGRAGFGGGVQPVMGRMRRQPDVAERWTS
jgi:methyl-accepting chemotaxis protein